MGEKGRHPRDRLAKELGCALLVKLLLFTALWAAVVRGHTPPPPAADLACRVTADCRG